MYLKANFRYNEPFEHDMSGLELYADGDDLKRIVISRVEPGSAGQEAGLAENDEIIAINLHPVNQLGIMAIDQMFKLKDNRSYVIAYRRKEVFYSTVLTLKRRI
jgi:C-terminal processing protease CtpA/Prc